jgi:hypothetical protein
VPADSAPRDLALHLEASTGLRGLTNCRDPDKISKPHMVGTQFMRCANLKTSGVDAR